VHRPRQSQALGRHQLPHLGPGRRTGITGQDTVGKLTTSQASRIMPQVPAPTRRASVVPLWVASTASSSAERTATLCSVCMSAAKGPACEDGTVPLVLRFPSLMSSHAAVLCAFIAT